MAEKIAPNRLANAKVLQLRAEPMAKRMKGYSVLYCQAILNFSLFAGAGETLLHFFDLPICFAVPETSQRIVLVSQ
jgi:hypothetical protein